MKRKTRLAEKFAVVHSNFSPKNIGGIESVAAAQVEVLRTMGIKTVSIYGDNNSAKTDFHEENTEVNLRVIFRIAGLNFLELGNLRFFKLCRKSRLVIFQEPFPTLWPAIFFLSWLTSTKIIVYIHATPDRSAIIKVMYQKLRAIVLSRCTVIATNPILAKEYKKFSAGSEVKNIPLSVIDRFDQYNGEQAIETEDYFIYIGRLASYKGLNVLLDAAVTLPGINFKIVGSGPLLPTVASRISSEALTNVSLTPHFVEEEEKLRLIKGSQGLILPSLNQSEAFGIVQIEAMMLGTPVVNTRLGNGVNWVAPNLECALTVVPGDASELTDAISRLRADPSLRQLLGDAGRKRYLDLFSPEGFTNSWVSVINKALGER